MSKKVFRELITDPSSDQPSMSRLCLGVLIVVYLPGLVAVNMMGYKLDIWGHLAAIIASVCGIYGVNSGLRVWRGRVIEKEKE